MPSARRLPTFTGFVLAGGASRRMGVNKAKLLLGDETAVERQVRLLRRVCRSVAVLGLPASFDVLGVAVVPDEVADRGPLGGLYTGLFRTRTELNLFLGCDLPFVDARFLYFLCRRALAGRAEAIVPISPDGRLQPLCAIYRRRSLGKVRRFLESGESQLTRLLLRLRTQAVPWPEITRAGFAPRLFVNMNTPQDYDAVRQRVELAWRGSTSLTALTPRLRSGSLSVVEGSDQSKGARLACPSRSSPAVQRV